MRDVLAKNLVSLRVFFLQGLNYTFDLFFNHFRDAQVRIPKPPESKVTLTLSSKRYISEEVIAQLLGMSTYRQSFLFTIEVRLDD